MEQDKIAQIEKMLEQGMDENQILAALGVKVPPPQTTPQQRVAAGSAMGARSMGPVKDNTNPMVKFAKRYMGIVDPDTAKASELEESGTIPLPFTRNRLAPGVAAMGLLGLGGMGGFAKNALRAPVRALPQAAPKPAPTPPTGVGLDRLLPEAARPGGGMMTSEEGGNLAMQMMKKFGERPYTPPHRLVPGKPQPKIEDIIAKILGELR